MSNGKRVVRSIAARPVMNKGYSHGGASYTKKALKGFTVESGSASEDINANLYTLRQRSRILYQTAPIATGALKRQRTNIVGPGLRLKATIMGEPLSGMTYKTMHLLKKYKIMEKMPPNSWNATQNPYTRSLHLPSSTPRPSSGR